MNLLKLATKIGKMSNREIRFRLRQKLRVTIEKYQWRVNGKNDLFLPTFVKNFKLGDNPFPNVDINFFGLAENEEKLSSIFNSLFNKKKIDFFHNVEQLIQNRFNFLGLDFNLSSQINWNANPQTGIEYSHSYFTLIDSYNTNRYGDVKYVWELNRHQYLIELGKAYYLTREERYAEKIWNLLNSWINSNPYKIGINYTSALEHAVRIFAWIWTYFFTQQSLIWTHERKELFAKYLLLQGFFIEENLSYYYSPYNHLVGELAALSFIGTVYSNIPKMKIWQEKYWNELEQQLDLQFHSDGFTVEQASYYHHFTLGFFLMIAILRKQNNLPVSENVWGKLEMAVEFSMYLTRPDGRLPMIGDIDNARSIYFYRPQDLWNLHYFLSIGAVLFDRGDFKLVSGKNSEEVLWLFGESGIKKYHELDESEPQYQSHAFDESSYYIMRDDWDNGNNYCCFDCGEIAHGVFKDETPSAAHGHADILSFELFLNGSPVIIDPGFNTYFGPVEWHRYFRSTRGHNTIEVNGSGQAHHEGRLGWSNVSSPKFDFWISRPELDFVSGAIDRFAKLHKGIFHRRSILFRKGMYFLIIDQIDGIRSGESINIESSFHFSPGKLVYEGNQLKYNDQVISLLSLPKNVSIQIECGGNNPDQGWIAKGCGYKEPAPVFRISARQSLPVYFGMVFPIGHKINESCQLNLERINESMICCNMQITGINEKIYLNPSAEKYSIFSLETDAFCTVCGEENGRENEIYFIKVNHFESADSDIDYVNQMKNVNFKMNLTSGKPVLEVWK